MKIFKQFLIYLSILSILVTFLTYTPKVYAEVPETQKAQPHSIFNSLGWNYSLFNKVWTIEDPTGIPASSKLTPQYFYTSDNITFFAVDGFKVMSLITTGGIGLVLKPSELDALISYFFAAIGDPTQVDGGVYDDNNNFLGYALNDISGCYYEGIEVTDDPDITIPKEHLDNMYKFYQYRNGQNKVYADYFTFYPPSLTFIKSNIPKYNNSVLTQYPDAQSTFYNNIDTYFSNHDNFATCGFQYSANNSSATINKVFLYNAKQDYNSIYDGILMYPLDDCHYIQAANDTYWDNFCDYFKLYGGNKELLSSEIWGIGRTPSYTYIAYTPYDNSTGNALTTYHRAYLALNDSFDSDVTRDKFHLGQNATSNNFPIFNMLFGKPYTVYKDLATYNAINVDKDYEQTVYTTKTFNDYSVNDSNNITIKKTVIDNSVSTNTSIYNDISQDFEENISNSTVNTENISNNSTTIIYNYYPELNPNPSNPDNPSDPDNPTDPDNPIEDGTILDAILAALKRFFDAIGKILGTILAGLLEVIDSVLEAIAGIMENLTGVTEFIGALFSWIPEPVPQILAAGISICILAAIFKFIRG